MSLTVQLHQDENHLRYAIYRGEEYVASISGDRHAMDTVLFIVGWDGETDDHEVRNILLSRLFDDCKAAGTEVLVHLTDARKPIFEALVNAGFAVKYEKFLYRHNFEVVRPPQRELSLRLASTLPLTEYQQLFWDCNQGDPLATLRHAESPSAFLQRFIAEIAELHVPEQMYVAYWADVPFGIINFRVTISHNITAGFMNYIGIHPDYRGQGFGGDLHRLGLVYLKEMHCDCYLGSTHADNLAMRAVFERNGVIYRNKQVFLVAP